GSYTPPCHAAPAAGNLTESRTPRRAGLPSRRLRDRARRNAQGERLMKRAALLLLGVLLLPAHADDKGTEVKFGDLTSTTPASWKPGKFGGFRLMEFKLPRHKDDEVGGDLAIFKGFGGSKKENLTRWKGQ